MTKQPLFIGQSISDAVTVTLAQFRARTRRDYGELLRLQAAGRCTAEDVRGIMQAVTFTAPGMCVTGRVRDGVVEIKTA